MLYSSLLSRFDWLRHGFGTREDVLPLESPTYARLKQIHSGIVVEAREAGVLGEGDGLITRQSGIELSIRTADCYPILLADPQHRAVAALHAGWRGTAAGIVATAIRQMTRLFGTKPAELVAAIGPGIGACCYEVGTDVASNFSEAEQSRKDGVVYLDLAAANHHQLAEAGLSLQNIELMGLCTFCEAGKFFSYRREKENAGRMVSLISLVQE